MPTITIATFGKITNCDCSWRIKCFLLFLRGKDNATAGRLAPSYNQLFANIDKTVENNGYSNTAPLHLKIITIQGLPVEDLPCIEVWDLNGLIFSSHSGRVVDSSCFWDSESGDAFFKVSQYIIGDFSIVCSFRGGSGDEKNKSAIIFKYQNSTGRELAAS